MNYQNKQNTPGKVPFLKDQIITTEDLLSFKADLIDEFRTICKEIQDYGGKKWLRSRDVCRKLGVSSGTLQHFRLNGSLPFTKVGGVIFYGKEDIDKMIESSRMDNAI